MNDEAALLAAIRAHPEDDTARLVYADWLQENGRPEEGEFVRTQCRRAACPPGDPEYPALGERDEELTLWMEAHVRRPPPSFGADLTFATDPGEVPIYARGFPKFLTLDLGGASPRQMRAVAAALERAFAVVPTRWLAVLNVSADTLAALLKHEVLSRLTHLTVFLWYEAGDAVEAVGLLTTCPHLRSLRGLHLNTNPDEAVPALAAAPWERLESLGLGGDLSADGMRTLAAASWFRGLKELTLSVWLPEVLIELARQPALPRLHTLDLSESNLGAAGWSALAQSRTFPALARLTADRSHLTGDNLAALARATGFRLAALEASHCGLGFPGAELARAIWADALQVLNLSWNNADPGDVRDLVAGRRFTNLRHLNLGHNRTGPAALAALAANPALRGLRALNLDASSYSLYRGDVRPEHWERFLTKLNAPDLRNLSLSGQPVGARAARLLAGPKFSALRRLDLRECRLTDPAVAALVASPTLSELVELDLQHNKLKTGPQALADASVMPHLSAGRLQGNPLPLAVLRKLRARGPGLFLPSKGTRP